MTTPLFRREALNARKQDWLGRPSVTQPIPVRMAMLLGVLAACAVAAFLIFGTYTHRVRLDGAVTSSAGVVEVFAPLDGKIASVNFAENDRVDTGEVLFGMDTGSTTADGDTQQRIIQNLSAERAALEADITRKRQMFDLEVQTLRNSLTLLEAQSQQLRREIALLHSHADLLSASADRYATLITKGIGTQQELEERQERHLDQAARLETLHRLALTNQQERAALRAALNALPLQRDETLSELHRAIARTERDLIEQAAARAIQVTAPQRGTVTAIRGYKGQMVKAHTPVLAILPEDGTPEIHLMAPSSAIAFVRPGARVSLRYAAFPHQKFGQHGGTVKTVSRVAVPATSQATPQYRITIEPDAPWVLAYGQREPLQADMQVEADVLLEERHLYEWIIAPVLTLRNGTAGPAT